MHGDDGGGKGEGRNCTAGYEEGLQAEGANVGNEGDVRVDLSGITRGAFCEPVDEECEKGDDPDGATDQGQDFQMVEDEAMHDGFLFKTMRLRLAQLWELEKKVDKGYTCHVKTNQVGKGRNRDHYQGGKGKVEKVKSVYYV